MATAGIAGTELVLPLERLFDDLPHLVFFIKDLQGRYRCVNRTLVERCGYPHKSALLGKRPGEIFPSALAARYEKQDQRVVQTGKPLVDQLELHLYPGGRRGWCLTNKYPVTNPATGQPEGIMGVSRDVETDARGEAVRGYPQLAAVLDHLQTHPTRPPSVEELAASSGLSPRQLNQIVSRLFHITPRQLILKVRLDEALHLLARTDESLTDIALATGFCDQSAFTRHFRQMTGLPPGAFRAQRQSEETPQGTGKKKQQSA
jgi:PAS domain S-box-containing protein